MADFTVIIITYSSSIAILQHIELASMLIEMTNRRPFLLYFSY